jgi:hypothetical protein
MRTCFVWPAHLLTCCVFVFYFILNNFNVQSSSDYTDQAECHPDVTWLPLLRDECCFSPPTFYRNSLFREIFEVGSPKLILVLQIISSASMSVIFLCAPIFQIETK